MSNTNDAPGPVLRPAARDWDPAAELAADREDNPLAERALTAVGYAVRVSGRDAFPATVLMIPVDDEALTGLDPPTIRVVRLADDDSVAPVTDSGLAVGLGYAWAVIRNAGTFALLGLPRDPLLREVIGDLGTARRAGDDRGFRTGLRSMRMAELRARRAALAAELFATDPTLSDAPDVERDANGAVAGLRLPRGAALHEVIQRIYEARRELPEETLAAFLAREAAQPPAPRAPVPRPGATIDWWTLHGDPLRQGNVIGSHISGRTVNGLRLRYRVLLDGPPVSVPAIVANSIYVGSGNSRLAPFGSGGTLFRLDLLTGQVLAQYTFPTLPGQGARQGFAGIACTPAVANGRAYFSALNGCIYCLDALTLTPLWITDLRHADPLHRQPVTHQVNATGWSSPLVVGNRVYVGFGEAELETVGFVYCLDAFTGAVVWLFCTCLMPGAEDNPPNVVPASMIGMPLPPGFRIGPEPFVRSASVWSSASYDPSTNRIFIGTGSHPQQELPQSKYCIGCLSLDAATGRVAGFFQPEAADNYRPDDDDTDFAAPPVVFARDGRSAVAIGHKGGSLFLLDATTMQPIAKRQLLPRTGGNGGFPGDKGKNLPDVDPHTAGDDGKENFYGTFGAAGVDLELRRLFVGVGGFAFGQGRPGIDSATTAFLRALNWEDLTDAWLMTPGPDGVARSLIGRPPMYTTPGEAGFTSPVVVNDVVLVTTSRPGCYAFDAENGIPLWAAPGMGPPQPNSFSLGPAIYGDYVVVASANLGILIYSL